MARVADVLWLDNLLAVPLMGTRVHGFVGLLDIRRGLALYCETLDREGKAVTFREVAGNQLEVDTGDGFVVKVQADNILLDFTYPTTVVPKPGAMHEFATMKVRPYSKLLEEMVERWRQLFQVLEPHHLSATRLGLIAAVRMAPASAPPGVQKMLARADTGWAHPPRRVELNLLVQLRGSDDTHLDQCHHNLVLDRSAKPEELVFHLDWQRAYSAISRPALGKRAGRDAVAGCESDARRYFQAVGMGSFDGAV